MRTTLAVFLAIVGLVCLSFGMGWFGVAYTKTVGKAQENANRTVYEQTQSYVEGKRQELAKYRLEYMTTKDSTEKQAIKIFVLHSFANFDKSKLDPDLLSFYQSLQQ
jgi:hypothetical protein